MSAPIAVYHPGTTLLHRLPVGVKLAGLLVLSIAIVAVRGVPSAIAFLAVAVVIGVVARLPLPGLARSLRGILIFALVVALLQWWWSGIDRAAESFLDLVSLALLALSVSVTTAVTDMLDAFVRWLGPLRRVGVDPDRVALTISLAIQSIPATITLMAETRDAARARGLERNPRAWLTPFVIRVVARAHETGAALQARGLGD